MADTKKIGDVDSVTTLNTSDYIVCVDSTGKPVKIKKADIAEQIRSVMKEATKDDAGLFPAGTFVRKVVAKSLLIYRSPQAIQSTAILLSVSQSGGAAPALYHVTISRSSSAAATSASASIKVLSGGNSMKLKITIDQGTGEIFLYLERLQYTPVVSALLMNTANSTNRLSLTEVEDTVLADAEYVPFA